MLVIHGVYHFARKTVAIRNDFCARCNAETIAWRDRTFDFLHVFFVPVLPLGVWRRWHCDACGENPHLSGRTRPTFRWAGTALLAVIALSMWATPISSVRAADVSMVWTMRVVTVIGFAIALIVTLWTKPMIDLREKLATITPLTITSCPRCAVPLLPTEPHWVCPQCGIARQ